MNKHLEPRHHIQREESWGFDRKTIDYIQNAAAHGLYEIRGLGAKRKVPHFDDLVFLGASLSRYALEGYRERCETKTVLGTRYASKPIELAIPITIAGMSFGALSANVKEALGRAATEMGTSTTTGDGGMTQEERLSSKTLVYQCLPSRYGFNPDDARACGRDRGRDRAGREAGRWRHAARAEDQSAGGGHAHAAGRHRPALRVPSPGLDRSRRPRHQDPGAARADRLGKADLREDRRDPHLPRRQARGPFRGGRDRRRRHAGRHRRHPDRIHRACGHPHRSPPCSQAVDALEELNMKGKVQLIVSGGIRTGADVAKAMAMGADAVAIGQGVMFAMGCNHDAYIQNGHHYSAVEDYARLGTAPGFCHHCHTGLCPVGITTQDEILEQRLEPAVGAKHVRNYLKTLNMELTTIARACGKQNVHHLEREDLVALTVEAAAMARVPLAGTEWIPGWRGGEAS